MSPEILLSRLSLRYSPLCRHSHRAISTTTPRQAQQQQQPPPPPPSSATTTPPRRRSTFDIATSAITESTKKSTLYQKSQAARDLSRGYTSHDLARQITRKWKPGDIYSPHDLSGGEMAKWKRLRRKDRPRLDVLDQLALNPIQHYKNFSIMSEYITDMGRIRHGSDTGLRPVNQRKMAKAIRRAMGLGLMPGVHRHPELLRLEKKI